MAFDYKKWTREARNFAGQKNRFGYSSTADATSTVTAAGYFDAVKSELAVGDIIEVGRDASSKSTIAQVLTVETTSAGQVTIGKFAQST